MAFYIDGAKSQYWSNLMGGNFPGGGASFREGQISRGRCPDTVLSILVIAVKNPLPIDSSLDYTVKNKTFSCHTTWKCPTKS